MGRPPERIAFPHLPIVFLTAAILACGGTTGAPAPTSAPATASAPEPTSTPAPAIFIEDDFSDPDDTDRYLVIEHPELASGEVVDGRYRLFNSDLEWSLWSVYYERLNDFAASVEIQFGPNSGDSGGAGLDFRLDQDIAGYRFLISEDGRYTLIKWGGEDWVTLIPWRGNGAIQRGEALNRLAVLAEGTHLTLIVNDEVVDEADDDQYPGGDIALVATDYDGDGTEVFFDNFLVTDPATWHAAAP